MPSRASARTSRASMSAASRIVVMIVAEQVQRAVDDQVRRMLLDASRPFPPPRPRRRRAQGRCRQATVRDPATFALAKSRSSAIGKDRTLVGLSLPRHLAFSARTSSSPVSRTEISTGRSTVASCGKALSAIAASAARADERLPGAATVPFLVGFECDLEHHRRPRPFIGFDDAADERVADDVGRR